MSYSLSQYLKAGTILLDAYNKSRNKETKDLHTPEQLREPLRMALVASVLSDDIDLRRVGTIVNIMRHIYRDKNPIETINPDDFLTARQALAPAIMNERYEEIIKRE